MNVKAMRQSIVEAAFFVYKKAVSPALHTCWPGGCCFQPTCSEYAALAVAEHGLLAGGLLAAWRVLRCHPFARGSWDPVPPAKPSSRPV